MNKIVFLNHSWLTGGMERVISLLSNELITKYEVYIYIYGTVQKSFKLRNEVHFIQTTSINVLDGFMEFVSNESIDLVIGNSGLDRVALDIYVALKKNNKKFIVYTHEYYFFPYQKISRLPIAFRRLDILKYASAVIFLTRFSLLAYHAYNKNGFLLYNPLSYEIKNYRQPNKENKRVLVVGRWDDPIKRIDRVLEVFYRIWKLDKMAQLDIVGSYDLSIIPNKAVGESVQQQLDRLSIPKDRIKFYGMQRDLGLYYESASLFLMVSDNEGFSMVLSEAGIYGLPALIFEIPGLDDIIKDGENGYIVQRDDYDSMAELVIYLLNNDNQYYRMSKLAWSFAQRFSREKIISRLSELIKFVIENNDDVKFNAFLAEKRKDLIYYTERDVAFLSAEYHNALYREYEVLKQILEEGIFLENQYRDDKEKKEHFLQRVHRISQYMDYDRGDYS